MVLSIAGLLLALWSCEGPAATHPMAEAVCRDRTHFGECLAWDLATCHQKASEAATFCYPPMQKKRVAYSAEEKYAEVVEWFGVDYGACLEAYLFVQNRDSIKRECLDYFLERRNEWKKSPYHFDFSQEQERRRSNNLNILIQVLTTLIPGLAIPFVIAKRRWSKSPPKQIGFGFGSALVLSSLLGSLIGMVLGILLGAFQEGIRLRGDNPFAVAGNTLGLFLLIPTFWVGLLILFRIHRKRG